MNRQILLLSLICAAPAWCQMGGPAAQFPVQLREFLDLTNQQVGSINQTNLRLREFANTKSVRRAQVQSEIAQETGRPVMDPMALGVRYRELELIRREVDAEQTRVRTELVAGLTAAQRTRLGALEEAFRLQGTACDAVQQNLLVAPAETPTGTGLGALLLGIPNTSSCGAAVGRAVLIGLGVAGQ